MNQYVIIGNGVAAAGCIEGIRSTDRCGSIVVISQENRPVYCRPLISYCLQGKTDLTRMNYRADDFYETMRCRVLYGERAARIDRGTTTVLLDSGGAVPYTHLCIAAGSSPVLPPVPGLDTVQNRSAFMTIDDMLALQSSVTKESRVLIIGAGLIGLKCAEGLRDRAGEITVCDLADRVLSSILDAECAAVMQARLEENGIKPSVIYGSLPPEIRRRQMTLFNEKKTQVVVSTDAIGMGLNLPVRRIVFLEVEKFDGVSRRPLVISEIKQIAGRAGRFGLYDTGYVTALGQKNLNYLKDRKSTRLNSSHRT